MRIGELSRRTGVSERSLRYYDADGGPSTIAPPRLVTDLTAERDRIDRMISDLVRSRDVLDDVIVTAAGQPGSQMPGS
jgi:hypothetical protein